MDPLCSETCWSTFKYFIIWIVSTYYILCISWITKCLITKLIVKYHNFCQQAKNMFGETMLHLPKILTLGLLLRSQKALCHNLIPKQCLFEPKVFSLFASVTEGEFAIVRELGRRMHSSARFSVNYVFNNPIIRLLYNVTYSECPWVSQE